MFYSSKVSPLGDKSSINNPKASPNQLNLKMLFFWHDVCYRGIESIKKTFKFSNQYLNGDTKMKKYIFIACLTLFAAQSNADGVMLSANDVQEITIAAKNVLTEAEVIGTEKGSEFVDPKEEVKIDTSTEESGDSSEAKEMESKG